MELIDARSCSISQVLGLRQCRWHFNPSNDIYSGSVKFPPAIQHRHWKKGKRPFHWTNCPIGPLAIDQSQHTHCRSFGRGVRNGMGEIDVGRNDPRPTSELFLRSYRVCSGKDAMDRAASERERTPTCEARHADSASLPTRNFNRSTDMTIISQRASKQCSRQKAVRGHMYCLYG